jgi:hypothetical protein
VLDTAKNLDIKRFKYGPNLVYTFDKLGLFVFSFTGCTFDQKAMKSMNLDGFESHTDAFTGKSIKDYKLGPYCCALFTKAMPPPPPVVTPPPVITPPPTKTDPNANKTYNFEVDFELDINESKPTVSIKKATYVG